MTITNEQLMQALTQPSRSIGRHWMAGANRPGVHMFRGRVRILTFIDPESGIAMADLIEKLDMRPSTATETINRLVAGGLVERRTDEQDRRAVRIHLTEEGKKVATGASAEANATLEEMFSVLSEAEREQLYALLEKLNAHLVTLAPEEPRGGRRGGYGPWGKGRPGMDPRDFGPGMDPRGFGPGMGYDPRSGFGSNGGYGPDFAPRERGEGCGPHHGHGEPRGRGDWGRGDDRWGRGDHRDREERGGQEAFRDREDFRSHGDFSGDAAGKAEPRPDGE